MGSVSVTPSAADLFFRGIDVAGADARFSNCHRLSIVKADDGWAVSHFEYMKLIPGYLEPRPRAPVSHRHGP